MPEPIPDIIQPAARLHHFSGRGFSETVGRMVGRINPSPEHGLAYPKPSLLSRYGPRLAVAVPLAGLKEKATPVDVFNAAIAAAGFRQGCQTGVDIGRGRPHGHTPIVRLAACFGLRVAELALAAVHMVNRLRLRARGLRRFAPFEPVRWNRDDLAELPGFGQDITDTQAQEFGNAETPGRSWANQTAVKLATGA